MGFGRKIIGDAAYAAEKKVAVAQAVKGHFGVRVVGQAVVDAAKAVPVPAPVLAEVEAPVAEVEAPAPTEAYNFEQAIAVAKKNVHDLPRLLDLELARPSGPRKTVLRAYAELALDGTLPDEVGLALDERITAALDAKE